jgi:hypothetical protein
VSLILAPLERWVGIERWRDLLADFEQTPALAG